MRFLFLTCLFFFAVIVSGNVNGQIIVTSTADSGPGSLREAVTTANVAGGETILFTGIPNPSVIIIDNPITLTSNINLIDGDIDGDGDPDVTLQSLSGNSTGLIIEGANNTVQNLHMENFGGLGNAAIRLTGVLAIGNTILGCYLGTDITGLLASTVAGNEDGLQVTAGASGNFIGNGTVAGRNIFSGNISNGLTISNSNNSSVQGNYIGLASDGNTIIPNLNMGVAISGTSTNNTIGGDNGSGEGNVISGNGSSGIDMVVDVNFIFGNYIGLDATGTQARGNVGVGILINGDNNEIGDNIPGYGNVISANDAGIEQVGGSGTLIEGNIVGLDATGTSPLGNLTEGVSIVGTSSNVSIGDGTISGANYISGNTTDGIKIAANGVTSIVVDFNFIGTGIDGVTQIGNGGHGVSFAGNTDGNSILNSVITSSGLNGINATGGSDDNFFTQNSIYNNAGDGISLGGAPSAPTIDAIDGAGVITGTGVAGNTIEIYLDADDEGQYYLGSTIVDGLGNWTFAANLSNFPSGVLNINATQFDGLFTSEFSAAPLFLGATFPPFVVVNTDDTGVGSLRWAIGNANADPDINTIMFNIPSSDPGYNAVTERWTIAPLTNIEDVTETVLIDATTQNPFPPASTAEYRVILDGAPNALNYGLQTSAADVEFYGFHFTGFDLNFSSAGISVTLGGTGTIIGDVNKGNIFNANSNGIYVTLADNNVIKGNLVGTDYSGTISIPNINGIHFASGSNTNIVGGPLAGEENLISGNTTSGIIFNAGGTNQVENNLIGTDITGLLPLGNGDGIRFTASNDNTIQDNTISGNTGNGIFLGPSSNNFFYGNNIGVGTDGSTPLSNNIGILGSGAPTTDVDNNTIGGTGAGEPNIIAHNTNEGISITFLDMEFNTFIANQIFLNGGKGIDLGTDGNDGKTPPVITAISTGTLSGTGIDGDIIHVYRDNTGSNPLQGAEYLGSTTVVGGVWTVLEGSIIPADLMNATATDVANNTSEFAIIFPEPEIEVFQGIDNTGTPITDGQVAAVDFGSALVGNDIDLTFAVENTGTGILDITNLTITGDTEFSVLTPLPPTINVGQTVNFEIRLSGVAAGTFIATITIDNSDADEAAFDFPVTGIITQPEIAVFEGIDNSGIPIIDGQVAAVDFGSALIGNDIDLIFAVENTGTGILDITNLTITGDTEFSVLTPLPPTINAGQTVNFEIRLSGAAAGTFNATITIDNSDADEAAFDFPITGTITQPEIEVFQGVDNSGIPIIDGQVAAVDFGSGLIGNDIDLIFAVENTGTGILDITNLTITGDAEFSVLTPLPPTINVGQTVNFEIRLSGVAAGTFNATITIDNSDADEAAFDFPVTGIITQPEIAVFEGIDNSGIPIIDGQVAAVDFGSALIGNDIDVIFAVENTGTGILDITNLTITGDTEFSLLTPLPPTINVGQTVNFEIRLSGAAAGTFNATITIDNSDADEAAFDFPITGIITQPEIEVFEGIDNTGTPITDGQVAAIDFGSALIGNDIDLTFAVENTGTGILDITNLTITGDAEFSVLTPLPPTINVGQTVNFEIRLSGAAAGIFNATITIDNSDADEAAFDFPITGIITQPEIAVFEGIDNSGIPIIDGQVAAVDFGSGLIGNDIDLTFAVENTGTGILDITNLTITGDAEFSVLTPLPPTINVGQTVNFEIRLSGAAAGTFNATITIDNSDADEAAFDFPVTGIITQPEIVVFEGIDNTGTPITDGQVAAVDFGSALIGNDIDLTFAVENTGTGILDITNLTITGDTEFSVLTPLPPTINAGQTVNFEIRLSGAAAGTFNATITIDNSDADEAAFDFPITGIITIPPGPEIELYLGVDNTGTPIINGQFSPIDFGTAPIGNSTTLTFAIENIGSNSLNISIITSNGVTFSATALAPTAVSPGATVIFDLIMDGSVSGTFNEIITIVNDDPDENTFVFPVTGIITAPEIEIYFGSDNTGTPIISNQVIPIDFGSSPIGSNISQTFAIENIGNEILSLSSISVGGTDFTVLNQPVSVDIGATVTFQVQLSGTNDGAFNDAVTIQSDDPDETLFIFPITGDIVKPEIEVYRGSDNTGTPIINNITTIEFGSRLIGNDIDLTFAIENVGTSDLTISSISSDGSKFSIITPIVSPISPNSTETFIIRLDGTVDGTYAETITISNNDSDEAIFTYSVTGNITLTIEPEISVFQGIDNTGVPIVNGELLSIDIGQTTVGNAITQFFAIENVGTDILTISSISITGTDFIILSAPASVPVGGTELFEIEFIGFSEGSYTEDLSIQSNDTDESVFQFPITASIFSPQINLYKGVDNTGNPIIHSETTVEFGSVEVSGIIDQTFAIENSGSGNLEITEIITGTKFIQIGAINSPISPGSTETFVLRFDGTEEGSFSEQVRIESNDPVISAFTFFAQGAVTCCPEPEISVYFGSANSGIPLAANQLAEVDLGITPAGIPLLQTFTIQNIGTDILNISEILVTEVEFSILSAPISVAIGSTETFQVELYGINVGSFSGIVAIQNDDLSESTFNFPIRGTIESVASPEITIYVGADNSGVGLTNGQVTVVDFGISPRNVDLHQTFSVENHGDVDLIVSSIDMDNPAFSTLSAMPIIISPGTFENFTIRLDGMTEGVYNGNVTVTNNDLNEASFQFPIIGEILVESAAFVIKDGTDPSGTVIQDGQQEPLDLGQTPQYQDIVKTMTIENTGETDIVILNITSDNIRYTIPTIPGPISPGSFDTFTLQLDASITGIVEANILVTSNLGDYTFSVISEVLDLGINPPLTVYNAVTPNGDGRHDYLKIENIEGYSSNKVTIFTKTGNRVFEIENYSNNDSQNRFEGFSNMKNNRLLTEGNYYYIINYTTSDGQNKSISGFILLGL